MIKYLKKKRDQRFKRRVMLVLAEVSIEKQKREKEALAGKDQYIYDMDNIHTTNDIINVLDILSNKITFVMTPAEAKLTDKYLIKK